MKGRIRDHDDPKAMRLLANRVESMEQALDQDLRRIPIRDYAALRAGGMLVNWFDLSDWIGFSCIGYLALGLLLDRLGGFLTPWVFVKPLLPA